MIRILTRKMKRSRSLQLVFLLAVLIFIIKGYTYPSDMQPAKNMTDRKGLKIDGGSFTLESQPFQILCGAIHYFRVMPDAYEDRIVKLKGMGLNSVDIYIPWNLHEPAPGKFSSKYDDQLIKFIKLAEKHNVYVILRPGPYICSEWDLGGLPSWLLRDSDMKIRSTYSGFTKAVTRYFNHLLPLLKPLQFRLGGPIIAIQIENEYGSFGSDAEYMKFIKQEFEKHDLTELHFVCDNSEGLGKYKMADDVLQTINFMTNPEKNIEKLLEFQPDKPVFVTEFWDGWFTHWGEKHHVVETEKLAATLEHLLKRGASVNFYMLHGGTNFGFMNGANANDDGSNYQCDVTSYDYDAPISEGGSLYVKKYEAFKDLIRKHSKNPPKEEASSLVVAKIPTESYGTIEMKHEVTIDKLLTSDHLEAINRQHVCSMEMLPWKHGIGQQYGYIVYQTKVQRGSSLNVIGARDYVLVMVNGQVISTTTSIEKEIHIEIEGYIKTGSENIIEVLVENAGRVNYGLDIKNQRKGILGKVKLDDKELTGWNIFPLQFEEDWVQRLSADSELWNDIDIKSQRESTPTLYKGTLHIKDKAVEDTFISFPGWFKGVLFVNGHNAGRYWEVGPQKTLYLPKSWLRQEDNIFLLFDLHGNHAAKCKGSDFPCLTSAGKRELGEDDVMHTLI